MTDSTWKRIDILLALVMLVLLSISISACGESGEDSPALWERDPIVPGYSMAEVNIGDPFSAAQSVHGDPEEKRSDGGYLFAYYGRTQEEGNLDDPGSWRLVITLYDNGNGYLDAEDEVGAVEVSAPYSGRTSGENGLGSTPQELEEEFGPCPNITTTRQASGDELQLYSYMERGVEFLVSGRDGTITVIVTAYGGLLPVEDENGGESAQGGLFGTFEADPIIPGQSAAGINIGDEFITVEEKYGSPDSSGFTTDGLVYATYTGGYGSWKLNLYLEDKDDSDSLGDFDTVVSISVRHPYAGKTAGGVGIGSPQSKVITEFGTPERESVLMHQGEEVTILEYNARGIVFALKSPSDTVEEIDVNRPLGT